MDKIQSSFTVFFEDPFWVGIFERRQPHKGQDLLTAAKVTFGAQPTDAQVYVYLLEHYHQLRFSPPVDAKRPHAVHNPKRMQRQIPRSLRCPGGSTKSQPALALMRQQDHRHKQ